MTALRDWHGILRRYVRGGETATSLRDFAPVPLDRTGVLAAWGRADDLGATILAGVRRAPCRPRVAGGELEPRAWWHAFVARVAAIARMVRDPALALGGGLDAAAVLIAWREAGLAMPAVYTLATGLAGYDEVDEANAIARVLDVRCEVIAVTPSELVALVPEAAVAAETPLYNLHPVHRLALARALAQRGHATLVTGDGADAVFRNSPDLDYVPIVAALASAGGCTLASPFFADELVDGTPCDPHKRTLRDRVRVLADRPKRARMMPALDLAPILDRDRIAALATQLDLPPRLDEDRERVGWVTLDHLVRSLG